MKISPLLYIVMLFQFSTFTSCEKDDGNNPDADFQGEVEFYLLDSYENLDSTPEIDLGSIVFADDPLLSYTELKSYNANKYYFKVTDEGRELIEGMEHSVGGVAFAVTANEEVVYTGYFVPLYSSVGIQWIVIDPLFWHLTNRMYVNLGYAAQIDGIEIPDHRNDERILAIFRRDGKLVE